jgi:hypothetical protein
MKLSGAATAQCEKCPSGKGFYRVGRATRSEVFSTPTEGLAAAGAPPSEAVRLAFLRRRQSVDKIGTEGEDPQ